MPGEAARQLIVFEPIARLLVVLHTAGAIVLIGASTHHFLIALGYVRGVYKQRLGRIYAATMFAAYLITYLLGAIAYPPFRYHVRAIFLDRYAPWASNLFDIKEHFASIGLPMVLGIFLLSRAWEPKRDRVALPMYALFSALICAIVWFNVFSGIIIALEKGM